MQPRAGLLKTSSSAAVRALITVTKHKCEITLLNEIYTSKIEPLKVKLTDLSDIIFKIDIFLTKELSRLRLICQYLGLISL